MSAAEVETTETTTDETTETTTDETQVDSTILDGSEGDEETKPEEGDTILGDDDDKGEDEADEAKSKDEDTGPSYKVDELELPDGMELSDDWKERITEDPVLQKASKEDAEHLLSLVDQWEAEKTRSAIEGLNAKIRNWSGAIEKHPEVVDRGEGGFAEVVREARAAQQALFGSDSDSDTELRRELRYSGIGSHPALVLAMAKVARKLGLVEDATAPLDGRPGHTASKKKNLFPLSAPDKGE